MQLQIEMLSGGCPPPLRIEEEEAEQKAPATI